MHNIQTGLTLMELLTVIIIIGVLATLGLSGYGSIREFAFDREAFANLKLIRAAQKVSRLETNVYYNSDFTRPFVTQIQNINTNLRLTLPTNNNRNWNYRTRPFSLGTDACAQATRNGGNTRNWRLSVSRAFENPAYSDTGEPVAGTCP